MFGVKGAIKFVLCLFSLSSAKILSKVKIVGSKSYKCLDVINLPATKLDAKAHQICSAEKYYTSCYYVRKCAKKLHRIPEYEKYSGTKFSEAGFKTFKSVITAKEIPHCE